MASESLKNALRKAKWIRSAKHVTGEPGADEWYTREEDIESRFRDIDLRGRSVLCNCDDPDISGFVKYFSRNFESHGLRRLFATTYKSRTRTFWSQNKDDRGTWMTFDGKTAGAGLLKGDGSFDSPEVEEIARRCDVIITNPPFSLLRRWMEMIKRVRVDTIFIGPNFTSFIPWRSPVRPYPHIRPETGKECQTTIFNHLVPSLDGIGTTIRGEANKLAWWSSIEIPVSRWVCEEPFLRSRWEIGQWRGQEVLNCCAQKKHKNPPKGWNGFCAITVARLPYVNEKQFEVIATCDKTTTSIFRNKDGSDTFARAIIRFRDPEHVPAAEEAEEDRTPSLFGKEKEDER